MHKPHSMLVVYACFDVGILLILYEDVDGQSQSNMNSRARQAATNNGMDILFHTALLLTLKLSFQVFTFHSYIYTTTHHPQLLLFLYFLF
jgi:hypothetical protein